MKTIEEYFESQDFSLEDKESLTAEEKAFLENFFAEDTVKEEVVKKTLPEKEVATSPGALAAKTKQVEVKRVVSSQKARVPGKIESNKTLPREFSLVGFFLGGEEFALPVEKVKEVIRYTEPTRFPGSGGVVKGWINLRGRITPIVDLSAFLDLPLGKPRFILVCALEGINVGFVSEKIASMHRVKREEVDFGVEKALASESKHIQGLLKKGEKIIHILNLESIKDFLINFKRGEV